MMYFGEHSLLYYAVILAICAVVLGFLGFGGLAGPLSQIAGILLYVFILGLIVHLVRLKICL